MKAAIGIDIGGTSIKGGVVRSTGEIYAQESVPTPASESREVILRAIEGLIDNLSQQAREDIVGIGISSPGQIDSENGIITGSIANIPALGGTDIRTHLERTFEKPVFVDNDANCAAYAEYRWGAGKDSRYMICLTLGTGVGGGMVFDGKLYRGVQNSAGELGHTIIVPQGRPCSCGNLGCIESYASASAVERAGRLLYKKQVDSKLNQYQQEEIDVKLISQLAKEGDIYCLQLIEDAASMLGKFVGGLINILAPDRIVIGGGMSLIGDLLFDAVRKHASITAWKRSYDFVQIVPAQFQMEAGILGSAGFTDIFDYQQ